MDFGITKFIKYFLAVITAVLFTLSIGVVIYGSDNSGVSIKVKPAAKYNFGWFYYDKEGHLHPIEKLPIKLEADEEGKARIVRSVTTSSRKDLFIDFYTHHQDLTVTLNGKKIYSYSIDAVPSWLKSYRSFHHLIKLPAYKSGELCIETKALIPSTRGEFNSILIGNKTEIIASIVLQRLDKFVLSFILLLAGIVLTFASNIYGRVEKDKTVVHLSTLMILTGLWQLEESRVTQIFIGFQPWHWCCEYIMRFFILILAYLFIQDLFKNKKHPALLFLFFLDSISIVVLLLLQLNGLVHFANSLFVINILYGIKLFYAFILVLKDKDFFKLPLKIIFASCMVTSILSYWLFVIGDAKGNASGITVSFALVSTFISLSILIYQKTVLQVDSFKKAKLYEKLAFVDIATGVYNKTAWYTLTEQYDSKKTPLKNCCLIMFDMNNLKYMNDKYGHLLGDKVIGVFCRCLIKAVGDKGKIYRIGGDEFLCLCNNTDILKVNVILSEFDESVKNQTETEIHFTAAYGYSFFTPVTKEDFIKAHAIADKDMYKNKQRIKALQNNAL